MTKTLIVYPLITLVLMMITLIIVVHKLLIMLGLWVGNDDDDELFLWYD